MRHFTCDFIGALTPLVASVTIFSGYSKAFGLNSVIKNDFQRNVSDTIYIQNMCSVNLTLYNDRNIIPRK